LTYVIAAAIGLGIFSMALWVIRVLATPGPVEPDPEDITEVAVDYKCTICGLRLTVTHAQEEGEMAAPRHCREPMVVLDQS
jgi:hypothetical protein